MKIRISKELIIAFLVLLLVAELFWTIFTTDTQYRLRNGYVVKLTSPAYCELTRPVSVQVFKDNVMIDQAQNVAYLSLSSNSGHRDRLVPVQPCNGRFFILLREYSPDASSVVFCLDTVTGDHVPTAFNDENLEYGEWRGMMEKQWESLRQTMKDQCKLDERIADATF